MRQCFCVVCWRYQLLTANKFSPGRNISCKLPTRPCVLLHVFQDFAQFDFGRNLNLMSVTDGLVSKFMFFRI